MPRKALMSLALLLAGCPYVGPPSYETNVQDADGDGAIAERFGGPDCRDDNPAITTCDADGDGMRALGLGGEDCDDQEPTVFLGAPERCDGLDNDCDGATDNDDEDVLSETVFYADADGDGFGNPDAPRACQELSDPNDSNSGRFSSNADDCDDEDEDVRPSATELCDGIDNNCDGNTDDVGLWYLDDDGDGYGLTGSRATGACDLADATGVSAVEGDCDDNDPNISPAALELPRDGIDQNCNGGQDDWDVDLDDHVPLADWAAAQAINQALPETERWPIEPGDCDDNDPARFVGNEEICDGVDNDCDESIDADDLLNAGPADELELRAQVQAWILDADGDGHFGTPVLICPADIDPVLHSTLTDDCYDGGIPPEGLEDADPASIFNGAAELCDGIDNNCDGKVDWSDSPFTDSSLHYFDADGDGYGDVAVEACGADPQHNIRTLGDDCNDNDATIHPDATEICGDPLRQDCTSFAVYDCDGDGQEGDYFGNGTGEDCDDNDAGVFATDAPNAEVCDGIDNDCDGLIDSLDLDNLEVTDLPFWYVDLDGDGFGVGSSLGQQCDSPGPGVTIKQGDCDDGDPQSHPDAPWYIDDDGDGFGISSSALYTGCAAPDTLHNWVRRPGDCNDLDPAFNPDTIWLLDNDGDLIGNPLQAGQFCSPPLGEPWVLQSNGDDCDDSDFAVGGESIWYDDIDGDGYGDPSTGTSHCIQPSGSVQLAGDCDDTEPARNPSMVESCDGVPDNDCDGPANDPEVIDTDTDGVPDCDDPAPTDPNVPVPTTGGGGELNWFADLDGDGFGGGLPVSSVTAPSAGYVLASGDCDDSNALVHPAMPFELCDGVDNNCDGVNIAGDPDVSNPYTGVFTIDGDRVYLGDGDGDGDFNLNLSVSTCADHGNTPELLAPNLSPLPLHLFEPSSLDDFVDCEDGGPDGTLYAPDSDEDGVPDSQDFNDLQLVCTGGSHTPGFVEFDGTVDCAPNDPSRKYRTGLNAYPDADGDGHASAFLPSNLFNPDEGCVGMTYSSPGDDCDDHNDDSTTGIYNTATNPIHIDSQSALEASLAKCKTAELILHVPVSLSVLSSPFTSGTDITFIGDGASCSRDTTPCITVTGGNAKIPSAGTFSFENLMLDASFTDDTAPGEVRFRESTLFDPAIITAGTVRMDDVDVVLALPNSTGITLTDGALHLDSTRFDGLGSTNGQLAILLDTDAGAYLDTVAFRNTASGIKLDNNATLHQGDTLSFESVLHPIAASNGASAKLNDVSFNDQGLDLGTAIALKDASLSCADCTFVMGATSANPIFIEGATADLRLIDTEVDTGSTFIKQVGGTTLVNGARIELLNTTASVLDLSGGTAAVNNTHITTSSSGPLFTIPNGVGLTTRDLDVYGGGLVFDNAGGSLTAVRLNTYGVSSILHQTSTSSNSRFIDLSADNPPNGMGTAFSVAEGNLDIFGATMANATIFLDQSNGAANLNSLFLGDTTTAFDISDGQTTVDELWLDTGTSIAAVSNGTLQLRGAYVNTLTGNSLRMNGTGTIDASDVYIASADTVVSLTSGTVELRDSSVEALSGNGFHLSGGELNVDSFDFLIDGPPASSSYLFLVNGGTVNASNIYSIGPNTPFRLTTGADVWLRDSLFASPHMNASIVVEGASSLSLDRVRIPHATLTASPNYGISVLTGSTLWMTSSLFELDGATAQVPLYVNASSATLESTTLVGPDRTMTDVPLIKAVGPAPTGSSPNVTVNRGLLYIDDPNNYTSASVQLFVTASVGSVGQIDLNQTLIGDVPTGYDPSQGASSITYSYIDSGSSVDFTLDTRAELPSIRQQYGEFAPLP